MLPSRVPTGGFLWIVFVSWLLPQTISFQDVFEEEYNINRLLRTERKYLIPRKPGMIRDLNEVTVDELPGDPLTPDEFLEAEWNSTFVNDHPPLDMYDDPIFIADKFEGDILLADEAQFKALQHDVPQADPNDQKWPNGVVPYTIDRKISNTDRLLIASAMNSFRKNTCITFIPRTSQRDYIAIKSLSGCYSLVGRVGADQPVSLGSGCMHKGIIIHELMHALGWWHEHSRPDRDSYIMVMYNNIRESKKHNFNTKGWDLMPDAKVSYDTGSVMHYGPYAFTKRSRDPTIVKKNPIDSETMGQREGFSNKDIQKINEYYCGGGGNKPKPTTEPRPTTKPTTSVTTNVILGDDCRNKNKDCKSWSRRGECDKNPGYMDAFCRASCIKGCEWALVCRDDDTQCVEWASKGECSKNPNYMKVYCQKSCKVCK